MFDRTGNLYGTTFAGPPNGSGLVFELTKPSKQSQSWTETILFVFDDMNSGGSPKSGLVFDPTGNLYGTTTAGATFRGGNVFRMKPPFGQRGSFNLLHGFSGSPDGAVPTTPLTFDKAGNLHGTTQLGGTGQSCQGGCGTVFQILR